MHVRLKRFVVLFSTCCLLMQLGCKEKEGYTAPDDPVFVQLPAAQTGITFRNDLTEDQQFNVFNYRNYYNGGGVAIGDINNDGLADIYFTANLGENKLYLNKGNWKFEDITASSGTAGKKAWSTGVVMTDVNGDGLLDIYLCNAGNVAGDDKENELFINKGNLRFEEQANAYGLDDSGLATHAAFFDYDLDGDLDCYLLNNSFRPIGSFGNDRNLRHIRNARGGHKLLRNDNGRFVDVSEFAGIYGSEIGFGLGVSVADLNGDKWPDIYVSNDFFEKDYLYINQHNGTFKEQVEDYLGHLSLSSMGSDIGDINNDGLMDIFTSEMLPEGDARLKTVTRFEDYDIFKAKIKGDYYYQYIQNALHLNNGDSTFSEIAFYSNVAATDWSWGGLFFDFNNDGWKDLFISNGIYKDITNQDFIDFLSNDQIKQKVIAENQFNYKEFLDAVASTPISNYAYVNQGDLTFLNQAIDYGLGKPGFSNGSAYGDLDNDGDLDLVVNNVNMESFVYKNTADKKFNNNYLRIRLNGKDANTSGIGAEIMVHAANQKFTAYQMLSRGFESSVDPVLLVGLGKIARIDSVTILWPNHDWQTIRQVDINSLLTIDQRQATNKYQPPLRNQPPLFKEVDNRFSGSTIHHENYYVDFDRERLIPQLYSSEGPACAKADCNGDGLDDVFITGAKADSGKLFIQTRDGRFQRSSQPAFDRPNIADATAVSFVDIDKDGDPDLVEAYGGNEEAPGASALLPRVYLNDGRGGFSEATNRFTATATNASCVRAADIDKDGDTDLFIGGRVIPGKYGISPRSYLLLNNGSGTFTEAPDNFAPGIREIGMVTDAAFADVDRNGTIDLVVVGEWMPVTIYLNKGNSFDKPVTLADSEGWWNCITPVDVDEDGDEDFILGNLGLNSKIKGDAAHPVELYVNDFDANGQTESVLCYYKSDSISYPMPLRGEMVAQMPFLKKRFLKYSDYAGIGIRDIFTEQELKKATYKSAKQFQSCVAVNNGKGQFSLVALPAKAQLSPVYCTIAGDMDSDGKTDLLLGGNFFGVKPELGRYDAGYGVVLKGDGKGNFTFLPNSKTGIRLKGEVRDMVMVKATASNYIVVVRNGETVKLLESTPQSGSLVYNEKKLNGKK